MIPNQYLYIDAQQITWESSYKCLGVFFTSQCDSSAQLHHVLQKTKSCINVLRRLSATDMGAGFHVLRNFYVQGIQSIIDYSATSLLNLTLAQVNKLETIQNKCMRVILGALRWTRLDNLRLESRLVSLETRIFLQTATQVGKFVSRPNSSSVDTKLCSLVFHPQDFHLPKLPWHQQVLRSIDQLNLTQVIKDRGADHPHLAYSSLKPWNPPIFSVITRPPSSVQVTDLCCRPLQLRNQVHSIE